MDHGGHLGRRGAEAGRQSRPRRGGRGGLRDAAEHEVGGRGRPPPRRRGRDERAVRAGVRDDHAGLRHLEAGARQAHDADFAGQRLQTGGVDLPSHLDPDAGRLETRGRGSRACGDTRGSPCSRPPNSSAASSSRTR